MNVVCGFLKFYKGYTIDLVMQEDWFMFMGMLDYMNDYYKNKNKAMKDANTHSNGYTRR